MSRADDIAEIHDVISRYSEAMDERRWELMNEVFTEDATVDMNGAMFPVGRTQIVSLIRAAIECCSITHHMNTNIRVEFSGDTARVTNRFRAWHRGVAPRENMIFEALGTYSDKFVRTAAGWRIQHRAERSPIEMFAVRGEVCSMEDFFANAIPAFAAAAKQS